MTEEAEQDITEESPPTHETQEPTKTEDDTKAEDQTQQEKDRARREAEYRITKRELREAKAQLEALQAGQTATLTQAQIDAEIAKRELTKQIHSLRDEGRAAFPTWDDDITHMQFLIYQIHIEC
jgi:hypothetical protein